jgi:hypothetical protein
MAMMKEQIRKLKEGLEILDKRTPRKTLADEGGM